MKGAPSLVAVLVRCSNLEDPGDTPRKGPLLGQKAARKGGASAMALGSAPSTPSASAVQLAGGDLETPVACIPSDRGDPEAPAPSAASSEKDPGSRGGGGGRSSFASLLRGLKMGSPRGRNAEAGVPTTDVEAGRLAQAPSGDQAFRIWSLPNEGAITTDPYTKVGGSIERNEGKPPVRPS